MAEVAARLAVASAEGGEFSPPFFIRETPIPKAKSGGCRAKRIGIGKLNNPAKRRS